MTRSLRRKLFYALLALFILVGGGGVFYAEGWRIDFATWSIGKVGGIYIRSFPQNASIYIDNQPVQNQSGFLSRGTVIANLLPRTHTIALTADGYSDWHENATVLPAFVTQYKYAVLVPTKTLSASSTAEPPAPVMTLVNPANPNQKIVTGKNTVSLFDVARATTTFMTPLRGTNAAANWIDPNTFGLLQTDGELYSYTLGTDAPKKLADDVINFAATDDGSMIAALERSSLEVFSLNGDNNYYRFNIPDVTHATKLIWYQDRTHLFVIYPDHISFLDLADNDLANFIMVARGTQPRYDAKSNSLFIVNPNGTLVRYQFPT
jgi:hypothetical protein